MDIGEKMKNRRLELGLSLEAVGNVVGVGKSTVRKWENGLIKNMGRDKIELVAKALSVTPGYLMGWEDDQNDKIPPQETKPRKYRMLSAGALTLTDEQLDKVYAMAHLMYPDTFPLEEKERKEGQ